MLVKCYKNITAVGIASRSLQNAYRMLLRLASYWTMTPANLQPFPATNSDPHILHALHSAPISVEVILPVEHLQVDVVDGPSLPPAAQCNGT